MQGRTREGCRQKGLFGLALLALLCTWSTQAHAAGVQFDASTTSNGAAVSSLTWSHTVANQINRVLIVAVGAEHASPAVYPTGVTYGGVSLTQIGTAVAGTTTLDTVSLWYLLGPAVGTANVVVTYAAAVQDVTAGATSIYGVKQAAPEASSTSFNNAGATTTNITTLTNGAWVLDGFVTGQDLGDMAPASGQTQRFTVASSATTAVGNSTKSVTTAGATTVSWTQTGINRSAQVAASFAPALTTLSNGTDPSNASLAPGGAATMADAFTFQTSSGTDTVTAITATLATGTSAGLSLVEITDNAGSTVYGSVTNPASDTPAITLSTSITATTTATTYKIRVTPKTHANMPAPAGASYAVTALVSGWTGANTQVGTDTAGTTVTIDNLSPGNVTASTVTSGNAQVAVAWTNPGDADLGSVIVLRRTTSAVTDTPAEGSTHSVGNTIGSSTVACVVTSPTASCTDTGLTNGTAYYYKIFAKDTNGNYATGATPSGSPVTPNVTTLATGTDPSNASLAPSGAATMADAFTFQTGSGTDSITAVTVTLASGTSGGLSLVEITDSAGSTVYGSATNPGSDTPSITLSTAITATTSATTYKIRVTPKTHPNMPAPAGSTYSVTAYISNWTGTNTHAGSDTGGTTVTIDNQSPGNVTASTVTAGNTQVVVTWTNPGDGDLGSVIVLRRTTSAVTDTPVEGTTYTVGNTIGSSTVACVVAAPTATCTDTGLTNGTAYYYKIFAKDTNGNYATGATPSGSPATPTYTMSGTVFEDVNYGGGSGRTLAASSGSARSGARVELYDGSGNFVSFTTTDGSGAYSFPGANGSSYTVRVVNSTVSSSRTGYVAGTHLAVQTYRTDASGGSAAAVTDRVGGETPSKADAGNGSTTLAALTTGSTTAQSITTVAFGSGNITGVDFGFNFDTIVNTNDSGQGSLRQFITNANALGGDSSLSQSGLVAASENAVFMISNGTSGSGLRAANNYFSGGIATISPASALPTLSTAMILDAQKQPGWSSAPIIELNGTSAGASIGLTLSGGSSIVRGFIVNRFTSHGIYLDTAGGDTVQGNYVGTNSAGTAASANTGHGIYAYNIASNLIGGTTAAQRNVVSGNNYGIVLVGSSATSNTISGNYVGLDAAGTAAIANSIGVDLEGAATGNTVGGTSAAARNVISGNTQMGVLLQNSGTSSNTVAGNYIGLNAAGSAAVANGTYGVDIKNSASGNTVGGSTGTSGNVISGNTSAGIAIEGAAASGNTVQGNYIGLNPAGTAAIANASHGIYLSSAPTNTIGGTSGSARNVISGNGGAGVYILGSSATSNTILGNYIGTNAAGTAAVANTGAGVWVEAAGSGNTIGGTAAGSTNVISGNTNHGVWLYSTTTGAVVLGNYIGTNAAGTGALPNQVHGVAITGGATNNTIGGTTSSARNVISGNTSSGVRLATSTTSGNTIAGNYIGVDVNGSAALGNGGWGVFIDATNTTVGGTSASSANVIANNGADGVAVVNTSLGNAIEGNSIRSNTGLGIDLADDGVTANNGTKNAALPNSDMDFPVFTSAVLSGSTLTLAGYVGSAASQSTFAGARVEVFKSDLDGSGYGEGQTYLGYLTSDGSGNISAALTVSGLALGDKITGTATDGSNNTSEFGANVLVTSTTTLGSGTDPGNTTLAPSGAATMADAFTFQTATGTDSITAVTVTLASGTSGGLSLVEITDSAGSTVYGSATNPGSDTPAITLSTAITVTTTLTTYKIRITPKTHANMPAPAGSSYAVTAAITGWTGTNVHSGSDTAGTTVTIDNMSPGNVTGSTVTSGNTQVVVNWTNPADADLGSIIVLRRTTSAVTDTPVEGTTYTVGNTIGSSTVACVVGVTTTCSDTGLTNGTAYYYKIFAKDTNGNYATGATPTGSPVTPNVTTLATGTDPGNASLAPSGAATMADAFTFQTASGTDSITAVTVTLASGTAAGLSLVEITNSAGSTVYGSATNPSGDTPSITLSTAITATTSATTYKIRITPKTHANMPAPAGSTYSATARISAWTGTNAQAGSDTAGTTVTIDNLSPGNVTGGTATAGSGQVVLTWTNPGDADLGSIVVLRWAGSAAADTPVEGTTYTVGNTIGASTVACVVTQPTATCTDTGLTNGTVYHYKIFAQDTNGNYATGVVPAGSPTTPNYTVSGTVFEDVNYGGGSGRSLAASSGSVRSGARVELYDGSGNFVSFTTTDGSGAYSFLAAGGTDYTIRVVNSSVSSSRSGYVSGTHLAVQTFRTDASSGSAVAVTDHVGGETPSKADAGNGSTTLAALTTGSTTAQSISSAGIGASNITGVDFGFNFDTIVNTNDSGQGSLRQFLTNANALSNSGLAQSGRTAGIDNALLMLADGTARAGTNTGYASMFSGGVATIAPASALPTISDPVVLDGQTQAGWSSAPIIELNGTNAGSGANGLSITAGSSTVRGLVINRFAASSGVAGIYLSSGNGNVVAGNYIGTNAAGTSASANYQGMRITSSSNTIGGSAASQRNVISGNTWRGILVDNSGGGASSNTIRGNYVGVNAAGTSALANNIGIYLSSSPNNVLGGTGNGEGNVTSGNTNYGIYLVSSGTTGNLVQGNTIGLNASRSGAVPNGSSGIDVCCTGNGATSNTIGGSAAAANVISGNTGTGIRIWAGTGNSILTNSIYGNGGIGIELGNDGVTANDGVKSSGQPNLQMDFPVFTSAVLNGSTLTLAGYVGSAPSQSTFAGALVEVFKSDLDASGNGEGQTYLGNLTADGSGNISGSMTVSGLALGDKVTGTATDGSNNTSEFGANVTVAPLVTLGNGTDPGNATLAPGGSATMADAFTFQTSGGTDTITAVTVTLATGTSGGLSLVEITNDAGSTVYGSVTDPSSDTPAITLSTSITATTSSTQYKVRVTPKSHANMPAPAGSTYGVTALVSNWTGTGGHAGSDSGGTTVTIDNLSPGNVTASSVTAGNGQVAVAWTNPADSDLGSVIVLRRTASAVTDTPVEGATYTVGNTIGSSTVACVVTAPTATCTDTGLTNGTAYYYKIFTKDANGNYSTGATPSGSPVSPNVTTLATGTDPGNASLAPGGAATMADAFTFQTGSGTDSITAVTVTLASGTSASLSLVEVTNDAGSTVYGSVTNPGSDTPAITLSTAITATTTSTQYKVRVTPKSHANMPAPAGASYAVTALVSAWTGTNTQAGSDTGTTLVTIDNLSPGNVTASTVTSGNAQVSVAWTNPGDADLGSVIVLRRTASAVTDTPTEGATYTVGNTIGSSTVACVVAAPTASCTDTGLTNGTAYYYKIFAKDTNGNYATGATPSGSPVSPNVTTLATGTDPGNTTIAPSGAATMADAFTFQTGSGTDSITAVSATLASGTYAGVSLIEITDATGATVHGSASNPTADTTAITLSTAITATTTATQYKIRITPKSHAAMPAPPGTTYLVTALISAWTGTNAQAGSDTGGTTLTIDNQSPADVTSATATAGSGQVSLAWTNPADSDLHSVIVLRRAGSVGSPGTELEFAL